jgi:hypothetical protein
MLKEIHIAKPGQLCSDGTVALHLLGSNTYLVGKVLDRDQDSFCWNTWRIYVPIEVNRKTGQITIMFNDYKIKFDNLRDVNTLEEIR